MITLSRTNTLQGLELVPVVVSNSRVSLYAQDHLVIVPFCYFCGKPITQIENAMIFGRLEEETHDRPKRLGSIRMHGNEVPILTAGHKLYAGHNDCIEHAEAQRELIISFRKPLSAVLKSDQQTDRDRMLEGKEPKAPRRRRRF